MFEKLRGFFSRQKVEKETAVAPAISPDLITLNKQLNNHFNIDELKTLCLELQIDYDQLSGDNKSAKVRELVIFCQRQRRLPELAGYLQKNRPTILAEKPTNERPPSFKEEPTKTAATEQSYNYQKVRQNTNRLIKLIRTHFNLSEIEMICLELQIPYDNIRGGSLDAKSRELDNYMVRRGDLSHLVEVCQQKRPDINWTSDEAKPSEPVHDVAAIQQLLQQVFADDEAMVGFCQIHFPDLLIEFGSGMSFQAKMNRLLDYGRRRQVFDTLLDELQTAYPGDFARYAPYNKEEQRIT